MLPQTVLTGILLAALMGVLSGLAPAISAAHLKIANAMRKVV